MRSTSHFEGDFPLHAYQSNPFAQTQNYTCSPLLLLHCNAEGYLMPVAIQLFANQTANNPVWTPNDAPNDWLLAKMFFNNANGQVTRL